MIVTFMALNIIPAQPVNYVNNNFVVSYKAERNEKQDSWTKSARPKDRKKGKEIIVF